MGDDYTELGQYIMALCTAQNLSLRQASMRAGLDPTTIARILQRDGQNIPRADTLAKIAGALNGDFYHMMGLAGHLPPVGEQETIEGVELYAKFQRLQHLVRELEKRDPEAANRLMGMVITPFEIMLALEGEETGEVEERMRDEQETMV